MSTQAIQWSTPATRVGYVRVSDDIEICVQYSTYIGGWYAVAQSTTAYREWIGTIAIHAPGQYETPEAAIAAAESIVPLVEVLISNATDYMAALAAEGDDV